MFSEKKKQQQLLQKSINGERRSFLKKAIYTAPTLIAMGTLGRPTDAQAGFGPVPSAPADTAEWQ